MPRGCHTPYSPPYRDTSGIAFNIVLMTRAIILTALFLCFEGEIKMNVQKKTYIITVTTYQMIILLLFNEGDNLSYR